MKIVLDDVDLDLPQHSQFDDLDTSEPLGFLSCSALAVVVDTFLVIFSLNPWMQWAGGARRVTGR